MSTETPRNVISLIRVSTEKQTDDKKDGFERQRRDIRFSCHEQNLKVVQEFPVVVTGVKLAETSDYKKIKAAISQSNIAGLVIPSIDRFTRSSEFDVLATLIEPLKELTASGKGKRLLFVGSKSIDMTTPDGRKTLFDAASMAEDYRLKFRYNSMEGRDERRRDAASKTDKIPAGILFTRHEQKVNDGIWSYEPEQKAVMREAFMRVLAGEQLKTVSDDLGFGSPTTLRNCLKIRLWCGWKTKTALSVTKEWDSDRNKYKRGEKPLTEAERKEFEVRIPELADDPCVTVDEFEAVQKVLAQHVTTWTQNKSLKSDFLAIGLMYCACGVKMYTKQNYFRLRSTKERKPGVKYYISAKAQTGKGLETCGCGLLHADQVDEKIRLVLRTTFAGTTPADDAALEASIRASMDTTRTAEKQTAVERSEKAVKELDRKAEKLEELALKLDDIDGYLPRIKAAKAEAVQARLKLETAKAELAATLTDADIEQAKQTLRSDFYWFNRLDMAHQQAMLRKYVTRIDFRHEDPLGIEPGLVFQFRVPVLDESEPAPAPVRKHTKHHDSHPIRVAKSAVSIGGAESLAEVIRRLDTDSKSKTALTSASTNNASPGSRRKRSVNSKSSKPNVARQSRQRFRQPKPQLKPVATCRKSRLNPTTAAQLSSFIRPPKSSAN